jgi:hypothetical protein
MVKFAWYPEYCQGSGSEESGDEDEIMELQAEGHEGEVRNRRLKDGVVPKSDLPAGNRWTEDLQDAAAKAILEQETNQSALDDADGRQMKLEVHHVSSPSTECQTTTTAVWRTSREDATIILCNPCYINKYPEPRKHTEQASWFWPSSESPTSLAMRLWVYSRNGLVMQESRAVEAHRVVMNSAMLRPEKFLGLPKSGDNPAGMLLTPHVFATPASAMKAVTKLQCFLVLLRMKHCYWKYLRHYHVVCDQSFLNQVRLALKPLCGKARACIKAWASFAVADMGMLDALDLNFPLCFDEPC